MALGMDMMIDTILKAMKINPEEVKKYVENFTQIIANIFGGIKAVQEQNSRIEANQKLIMEKLGIVTDEQGPVVDFPARLRNEPAQSGNSA